MTAATTKVRANWTGNSGIEEEVEEDEDEEEDEEEEDEELDEDEEDVAAGPCMTETVLSLEFATYTSPEVGFKPIAAGSLPTASFTICWLLEPSTVTLLS